MIHDINNPEGSVQIKINVQGFFFQPNYMTLEKEGVLK